MCALYGDIFDTNGTTVVRTYTAEIRRLCGNPRPEVLSDSDIDAARRSASEQVERSTRISDVNPLSEVELYNLMSEASNYYASSNCMAPMNDKQEARKVNTAEGNRICSLIREGITDIDPSKDISEPIVSSPYATGALAEDGQGEGPFYVTRFAKGG